MVERVLWLNGTVGSGKTTIGALVARQLASSERPAAFVSTDWLGDLSPRSVEDPFNAVLVATNLAAVTANFSEAGARDLVVAGVIQDQVGLARFTRAVAAPVTLIRLAAPREILEERLRGRHGHHDPRGLRWHLDRAPVLSAILDGADLQMVQVSNTGDPTDTADAVLVAAGWSQP